MRNLPNLDSNAPPHIRAVIGCGRVSTNTFVAMKTDRIEALLRQRLQEAGLTAASISLTNWSPNVDAFPGGAPKVDLAFLEATGANHPKLPGRPALSADDRKTLKAAMQGATIIAVQSIGGDNAAMRFWQTTELAGLMRKYGGADAHLHLIHPYLEGMRADRNFMEDGEPRDNALTPENYAMSLKGFGPISGLYVPGVHSNSGKRLLSRIHPGSVFCPTYAEPAAKAALDYIKTQNIKRENIGVACPDGAMKHLIGSAKMLAYIRARLIHEKDPRNDDPALKLRPYDQPDDHPALEKINQAYDSALEYFLNNPEAHYDFEPEDGSSRGLHTGICGAWKMYCAINNLPADTPVPLRYEDFAQHPRFVLIDKHRVNENMIEGLKVIGGQPGGLFMIQFDDISDSGGTMIKSAIMLIEDHGAASVLPVLMHGSWKNADKRDGHALSRMNGYPNGLANMLNFPHPTEPSRSLFPKVICSSSLPAVEQFKSRLLRGQPELQRDVETYSEGNVIAECAVDAIMRDSFRIPNPRLTAMDMQLPEYTILPQLGIEDIDPVRFFGNGNEWRQLDLTSRLNHDRA